MLNERNCLLITLDHLKLKLTFYTPVSCTLLGQGLAGGLGATLTVSWGHSWFWGKSIHLHFVGEGRCQWIFIFIEFFFVCLSPGPFSACLWLFVYLLLWVLWTLKKKKLCYKTSRKTSTVMKFILHCCVITFQFTVWIKKLSVKRRFSGNLVKFSVRFT